ncbi:type II toxin-antitoxin system TacA family antitoxin [Duganella vulcania]|nr:DUF1778 domain-containing protein [Duganella vulcania]
MEVVLMLYTVYAALAGNYKGAAQWLLFRQLVGGRWRRRSVSGNPLAMMGAKCHQLAMKWHQCATMFWKFRKKALKGLTMNTTEERGRITARVSTSVAEKLQEAADLTGATLNQFLVQAALKEANRVIEREHTIRYTREDAAMLINLLDSPPSPNPALAKAFAQYKTKVENGILTIRAGSGT